MLRQPPKRSGSLRNLYSRPAAQRSPESLKIAQARVSTLYGRASLDVFALLRRDLPSKTSISIRKTWFYCAYTLIKGRSSECELNQYTATTTLVLSPSPNKSSKIGILEYRIGYHQFFLRDVASHPRLDISNNFGKTFLLSGLYCCVLGTPESALKPTLCTLRGGGIIYRARLRNDPTRCG